MTIEFKDVAEAVKLIAATGGTVTVTMTVTPATPVVATPEVVTPEVVTPEVVTPEAVQGAAPVAEPPAPKVYPQGLEGAFHRFIDEFPSRVGSLTYSDFNRTIARKGRLVRLVNINPDDRFPFTVQEYSTGDQHRWSVVRFLEPSTPGQKNWVNTRL